MVSIWMRLKPKFKFQGILKSFNLNGFINFILTVLTVNVKGENLVKIKKLKVRN